MQKLGILIGFVLLIASSALAQDTSKFQLAAGYEYTRLYAEPGKAVNCSGGNGQFDWFFARNFAVVADLGDCVASNLSPYIADIPPGLNVNGTLFTYQFGPKFAWRSNRIVESFAQVLFGGAHPSVNCGNCSSEVGGIDGLKNFTISASLNTVGMTAGGGLDIRVSRSLAIRAIEADYLLTYGGSAIQNSFQIDAGLVLRFD